MIAIVRTTVSGAARARSMCSSPFSSAAPADLDAVGQHEAALELARGDAAVQVDPAVRLVRLSTADHQLVAFER